MRRRARRWRLATALLAAAIGSAAFGPVGSASAITPAPPEFYGVATSTDLTQEDFNRLARANIRTVRFTLFWPNVQRGAAHDYYWVALDSLVAKAARANIRLIPTLLGSPKHISANPYRPPVDSGFELQEWRSFAAAAAQRYGPGGTYWSDVQGCEDRYCIPGLPYRPVRVWQAWNEPNLGVFWPPSPSPGEYARLLGSMGDAIHQVNPGAEVITGGIMPAGRGAPNAISQNDFLARLYADPGMDDRFDGVDLHPYARKPRGVRRLVQDARAVMAAYGDGEKPLWVTEVGWSTHGPKNDELVTSRKGQARRLSRTLNMLTSLRSTLGLQLASWFTYRDGGNLPGCDWCPGAGLLDEKRKPKPAWKKYAKLTGGQP